MTSHKNKHSLVIKDIQEKDFGAYTCHASNIEGSAKSEVVITGKHRKSVFTFSHIASKCCDLHRK